MLGPNHAYISPDTHTQTHTNAKRLVKLVLNQSRVRVRRTLVSLEVGGHAGVVTSGGHLIQMVFRGVHCRRVRSAA